MNRPAELEKLFQDHSIDYIAPEFYNHPAFLAAERKNPEFLWEYADYVRSRHYPEEYVRKATDAVPRIVQFLFDALVEDGRLGACLDVSLATSKILEQYGFWNAIQTGSLTADLSHAKSRKTRHWAQLMPPGRDAKVGHAWLVVPPFIHIDLTVTRQQENDDMRELLPPYIITKEVGSVEGVSFEDMVDPELKALWFQQTGFVPTIHEVMKQNPAVARYMTRFRPFSVQLGTSTLKYFPCHPTAAEETFEKHTGHCFSGRRTPEVFEDLVRAVGMPEEIGANS
ncbi:hypothetical protein [Planctellipticum variicoloris]|uniref:hypothetical protein n=1 Tax=Planctellipticum variicoloris TaxID=3064265 RepID=UPI0030137638|nr:hypothetical protein SH412_004541 [Planctomycetaceae bacterium SH412]